MWGEITDDHVASLKAGYRARDSYMAAHKGEKLLSYEMRIMDTEQALGYNDAKSLAAARVNYLIYQDATKSLEGMKRFLDIGELTLCPTAGTNFRDFFMIDNKPEACPFKVILKILNSEIGRAFDFMYLKYLRRHLNGDKRYVYKCRVTTQKSYCFWLESTSLFDICVFIHTMTCVQKVDVEYPDGWYVATREYAPSVQLLSKEDLGTYLKDINILDNIKIYED
jgi:hypothetical protein